MKPDPQPPLPRPPTVHEADAIARWWITIEAGRDPLLLTRVLQKLAVPAVELMEVHYEADADRTMIRLRVQCEEAWVRLCLGKLRKLVAMRSVTMGPG